MNIQRSLKKKIKRKIEKAFANQDLKCTNIFMSKNRILKFGYFNLNIITIIGMAKDRIDSQYLLSCEIWKYFPFENKTIFSHLDALYMNYECLNNI